MESINFAFEDYLSSYFNTPIKVLSLKEIPGGRLSKAYILSCKKENKSFELFARTINSNRGGYVYPIDRYRAFQMSDQMYKNADADIKSYGIMTYENRIISESQITNKTEFFHIQDFKAGSSYQDEYFSLSSQTALTTSNEEMLRKIARKIGTLHKKTVLVENVEQTEIYARGYRELLINPELTFDVLYQFDPAHPFFWHTSHKYAYLEKMTREYDRMTLLSEKRKLSYLHGDFWYSNILIDKDSNPFFIDYSRVPYGDAGIDIGWLVGNFALDYIKTKNHIYLEAASIFMEEYKKETGDQEILQYAVLTLFWCGIISIYPPIFGDRDTNIAREILDYIDRCFQKWELVIENLHS